jgi:hypothetical protein
MSGDFIPINSGAQSETDNSYRLSQTIEFMIHIQYERLKAEHPDYEWNAYDEGYLAAIDVHMSRVVVTCWTSWRKNSENTANTTA